MFDPDGVLKDEALFFPDQSVARLSSLIAKRHRGSRLGFGPNDLQMERAPDGRATVMCSVQHWVGQNHLLVSPLSIFLYSFFLPKLTLSVSLCGLSFINLRTVV